MHGGIAWMEPRDLHVRQMNCQINAPAGQGISSKHPGGAQVVWCDGSASFLPDSASPDTVRAIITVAGGERISEGDL